MHYSVLVILSQQAPQLGQRLAEIALTMDGLGRPYEVLCILDGQHRPPRQPLDDAFDNLPCLRALALAAPGGRGVALAAGVLAAQGQVIIAPHAASVVADQIPRLLSRLPRFDAVFGYPRVNGWQRWLRRTVNLPMRLALGATIRDACCPCWVARREALAGLPAHPKFDQYLAHWIARRGFRVGEQALETTAEGLGVWRSTNVHPFRLWHARWFLRGLVSPRACELALGRTSPHGRQWRFDPAQPLNPLRPGNAQAPFDTERPRGGQ